MEPVMERLRIVQTRQDHFSSSPPSAAPPDVAGFMTGDRDPDGGGVISEAGVAKRWVSRALPPARMMQERQKERGHLKRGRVGRGQSVSE